MEPKESNSNSHFWISMVKSVIRIGAGCALLMSEFVISGLLFILAEILGIVEEL